MACPTCGRGDSTIPRPGEDYCGACALLVAPGSSVSGDTVIGAMTTVWAIGRRFGGADPVTLPSGSSIPVPEWPTLTAMPAATALVLNRAQSIQKVYRVIFEEAAKGISGQKVDAQRVDRALDEHVQESLGGTPWLKAAAGEAFRWATRGSADGRRVLDLFPKWVEEAVEWFESLFGNEGDQSEQDGQQWAQNSVFQGPPHDWIRPWDGNPTHDTECRHCGHGRLFGPPYCPAGPCRRCSQLLPAHDDDTLSCPRRFAPEHLR